MQHVSHWLLPACDDKIAGNKPEQDEKAAADELVAADRMIGNNSIVTLSQGFEFERALHQLPLLRRRFA
jgi:hypothetical protein